MRQKINEHFPITSGSTCQKPVSQPTLAPAAYNTNQNGILCLPLMSENQKIIWVHSDQIRIQEDKVAKLDEAFSRFPYITQKQTISLAQSCSMHPDQVKVWFMMQRLCYGISWDSQDINEVRRKMLGSITPKRKLQKCEKATMKTTKLSREEEGDAENEAACNPCVIKKETLSIVAIEGQMNAEKKKRKALKRKEKVLDPIATKISQIPKTETAEANSQALLDSCSKPDTAPWQTNAANTFAILDKALDTSPSVTLSSQVASSETSLLVEKKQLETNHRHPKSSPVKKQKLICKGPLNARIKTDEQRAIMKIEFAKDQYPSAEQYHKLSLQTGIPRCHLAQWFSKMRYTIKKAKPPWLSVEQHKRAVANVVREQNIEKLNKMQNSEDMEKSSSGKI